MSRAALRGEPVDVRRPKPQPSKQFQQPRRPVPAATPPVLIQDQGEGEGLPVTATLAEIVERRAKSKAHYRPTRKATPPAVEAPEGEDSASGPAIWLLDALRFCEEQDAQVQVERTQIFVKERVQRQSLPRLSELLDLEPFRPKRGKGFGTAGAGALAAKLHELARIFLAAHLYLYSKDGKPPSKS
ncbi:hypothetical protein ACFP9V_26760 [Deinococcus radiopugnans]|uniref:hypothetical protein n=1 Tax=Deinococcus radiopugnans TaxID=57497 RepID=UPI00361A5024